MVARLGTVGIVLSKDFAKFFGEAVRRHRKAQKLSQEALAEKSDLSMRMISLVETGKLNPTVNAAYSIAGGLKVPYWKLVRAAEVLKEHKSRTKR